MEKFHALLRRQLNRHVDEPGYCREQLDNFIYAVNEAYEEFEKDRCMLERSLDISSRELCQANDELRAIFEAIPDLFFRIDFSGTILSYKKGTKNEYQLPPSRIIGQKLYDLLPLNEPDALINAIHKVKTNKNRLNIEQGINSDSGKYCYEIRLLPLSDNQILVILRDITARKAAEDDIAQSWARLEVQNRMLFEIAENFSTHEGDIDGAFHQLTEAVANTLGVERVGIWFFNHDRTAITSIDCYERTTNEHTDGVSIGIDDCPNYFKSLSEERVIAAHNARTDPRTIEFLDNYLIPFNIVSMLDAPIRVQGRYAGVICHEHTGELREWTPDEQQFAASMADMIALVCETHERQNAQRALFESEKRFRTLADTTDGIIFVAQETFQYVNPAMEVITGFTQTELLNLNIEQMLGSSFAGNIRKLKYDDQVDLKKQIHEEIEITTKEGEKRWLYVAASLICLNGQLTCLASAFDITERKLMEEQLRHQAFHDQLTGLANRALFIERLEHCIIRMKRDTNFQCAVLFLDIDRFKVVNDSLGHQVGDELLIEIGRRLKNLLREVDTVARMGGDEFTILLEELSSVKDVVIVAERIQDCLKKVYNIQGHEIHSSVSIGIAVVDTSYKNPDHVLRDADIAMYRAKSNGKACHEIFNTQMHTRAQKLLQLENNLRRAVKAQEFELYYQPIISVESATTVGFEALIRWNTQGGDVVPPAEFIPLAEETGLIIPLGQWIINTACEQISHWQTAYPEAPPSLSINLSGRQFEDDQFVDIIQAAINRHNINPELLKLELTESMIMESNKFILEKLYRLKSLGCELLIDDFGTGYSSLSYLHQFPIDALKIDRSFIGNINPNGDNLEIASSIISLAHNLGLKVVAEGVETASHLWHLEKLSCNYVQGYYFSKPLILPEAEQQVSHCWWSGDLPKIAEN